MLAASGLLFWSGIFEGSLDREESTVRKKNQDNDTKEVG